MDYVKETLPIKEKISKFLWKTENGRVIRMGIGCGNMRNLSPGEYTESVNLLGAAYDKGFRFFDTSSDYDESELIVGEFLKRIDRKTIFLSSKSPFAIRADHQDFHNNRDKFVMQFKDTFYRSFERLGTDYIDLYLIHDTENYSRCEREIIPFLKEQKEKGLIGYFGTGMFTETAHELAILYGGADAVLSYMGYSLIKNSASGLIETAKKHGAAFINASVLHFGLIKCEDPLHFRNDMPLYLRELAKTAQRMQEYCKSQNISIIAPALQISLLNPDIDITLNGLRRNSNLDSTIEAVNTVIHPEQWAEIFRIQNASPYFRVQGEYQY